MTKTFLFVEQGGHLSLGSLPGRCCYTQPVGPPDIHRKSFAYKPMKTNPEFQKVPFLQEKLTSLKLLIASGKANITTWEKDIPPNPLLPVIKEQVAQNEKLLAEVTGGQSCL